LCASARARAHASPRRAAQQTGDAGTTVKQLEADSVRLNAAMAQSVATHKNAVRTRKHFSRCIRARVRCVALRCTTPPALTRLRRPQVIEQLVSYVTTV
jgi:hypothetical protein